MQTDGHEEHIQTDCRHQESNNAGDQGITLNITPNARTSINHLEIRQNRQPPQMAISFTWLKRL